jgi:hypothetical protein
MRFLRFLLPASLLVIAHCNAANVKIESDAAIPSPDANAIEDSGSDGGVCGPVSVTTYTPSAMHPPNPPHAGKCTDLQIADYAACEGGATAKCSQFGTGEPSAACGACIETKTTDATWGVVVFDGSNGTLNVEGCVDDALDQVNIEPASCGQLLFASYGCQDAACALCAGSALDTCDDATLTGGCATYDAQVESDNGPCGALLGDAAPTDVGSCFPNPTITDVNAQRADFITRMAKYMCGTQ